jgi:hypothetical protein
MIYGHLSSDSRPEESQYAGVYPVLPGPCDLQVKKYPIINVTGLI